MKEMKKIGTFTDKEWEELASILSGEKGEQTDLLGQFMAGDTNNSGKKWKDLKNMNSQEKIDVEKAWNNVHSRLIENGLKISESPVRIRFMRTTILRIAAVVSLPDGSKIYLNRNSELNYRKNFGKHGRNVKLAGEAFFEISPDKSKPFIIDAGNAKVKVLGTSFNVITNNRESAVEVFVKTGKVLVSDNSGSQTLQLDPGYVGTVSSRAAVKTVNNNPNYLAWKTGELVYSGQKLSVVFSDLKRVYNMDIVADDSLILDNPWRSPIVNTDEETIINLICRSFNLGYTKDGNVYHLSKK